MPPRPLAVQVRCGPADKELVVVLRYAYTGRLPPERERARMARELLSAALSGFERPETEISFIGFREDAHQRIRNDELHLDLSPKPL